MLGGYDRLHYLLLSAFSEGEGQLSYEFLRGVEGLQDFDTHPLYTLLHEPIYCQNVPSNWSAERLRSEAPNNFLFDANRALDVNDVTPVYFTGEMVYPWMLTGAYPMLAPLRLAGEILATKNDWPKLYDLDNLRKVNKPQLVFLIAHCIFASNAVLL